jgi:hypothetical protein
MSGAGLSWGFIVFLVVMAYGIWAVRDDRRRARAERERQDRIHARWLEREGGS